MTGATPVAVSDCLNFGSPENPEVMWQFGRAVEGIADGCMALEIPVTGGNVSFYNQTGDVPIHPTPVIAVLGVIDDVAKRIPSGWQDEGNNIYLLGTTRTELDGSAWAEVVHGHLGGRPPLVDLAAEHRLAELLRAGNEQNIVSSAHDLADGGLAQALIESALRFGVGARVWLGEILERDGVDLATALFSESTGRVLVSVPPRGRRAVHGPVRGPRLPGAAHRRHRLAEYLRAAGCFHGVPRRAAGGQPFPAHLPLRSHRRLVRGDRTLPTTNRKSRMKTRTIGDVTVSAIGFGGMPISIEGRPDEAQAIATIHAALDAGITFIDTADAYRLPGEGIAHNELLIAKALKSYPGDTSGVLVATKGGHLREEPTPGAWQVDGRPEYIKRAAEASLTSLGVDVIGLYQFHRPDPAVDYADSVGAIRDLLDEGKIRMAGISNANPEQIRLAQRILDGRLVSVQNQFSPGLPLERARTRAVRRARHRVPAVEPARRHRPRRNARRPLRALPADRGGARREPAGHLPGLGARKVARGDPDPGLDPAGDHHRFRDRARRRTHDGRGRGARRRLTRGRPRGNPPPGPLSRRWSA